jgi:hypothetical protein
LFTPQLDGANGQHHERRDEEQPDTHDPPDDAGHQDQHTDHGSHQVDRGRGERSCRRDRRRSDTQQQRPPRGGSDPTAGEAGMLAAGAVSAGLVSAGVPGVVIAPPGGKISGYEPADQPSRLT